MQHNYSEFEARWNKEWNLTSSALASKPEYLGAYKLLVSLQAWRSELLEEKLGQKAGQFCLEGQNDLLVSYILARSGQWRSSLQSQRSAIENYLNGLFFMDHRVELELWEKGSYKTQFSELIKYFSSHPKHTDHDGKHYGIDIIKSEYATLSKAVHGSATAFRMTSDDGPVFFSDNVASLRKWKTRLALVVRGLNLLLISLFREELIGSGKSNLRSSIAYALNSKDQTWLKSELKISIKLVPSKQT